MGMAPSIEGGTAVSYYAGIDVPLDRSSVCVVDATGRIVREGKVTSEPEALVAFLRQAGVTLERVGLEAGPLSQWLHAGLVAAGLPAVLIETRHVKAALKAMTMNTDRNDARGIAHLMRLGWFRPVHAKTLSAQEIRALLTARKQLVAKLCDLEASLRGILRGFGLKVGDATARPALYEAATVMLSRAVRFSSLKAWALRVAGRAGMKKARVALARKLAVILHRMWVDGTSFRWSAPAVAAA